eukprot:GHVT01063452.1.p1 GENE.GHVT01063452.1~~GHVT01063452.1.p1  ORF type:complete len:146 (+),score=15.06 GHVT01063452.1:1700-2137(+)
MVGRTRPQRLGAGFHERYVPCFRLVLPRGSFDIFSARLPVCSLTALTRAADCWSATSQPAHPQPIAETFSLGTGRSSTSNTRPLSLEKAILLSFSQPQTSLRSALRGPPGPTHRQHGKGGGLETGKKTQGGAARAQNCYQHHEEH